MKELTIVLPIPSAVLSANTKTHWRTKAKKTSNARQDAMIAAVHALKLRQIPQWKKATVLAKWYFGTRGRRDPDNYVYRLKASIDGFRDAGIIKDDGFGNLVWLPAECHYDKDDPRVEITITEIPLTTP